MTTVKLIHFKLVHRLRPAYFPFVFIEAGKTYFKHHPFILPFHVNTFMKLSTEIGHGSNITEYITPTFIANCRYHSMF